MPAARLHHPLPLREQFGFAPACRAFGFTQRTADIGRKWTWNGARGARIFRAEGSFLGSEMLPMATHRSTSAAPADQASRFRERPWSGWLGRRRAARRTRHAIAHALLPLTAVTAVTSNLFSNVPAVLLLVPVVQEVGGGMRELLVVAMASTLAGN
ncbi:MAG: hypothetical protein H0U69_13765, partial [Trueperaceae bacterium]|nr:hypothetical protein [Trueperaceae bacterium]